MSNMNYFTLYSYIATCNEVYIHVKYEFRNISFISVHKITCGWSVYVMTLLQKRPMMPHWLVEGRVATHCTVKLLMTVMKVMDEIS